MLWPLDCFVARAPRNDGWVAADPDRFGSYWAPPKDPRRGPVSDYAEDGRMNKEQMPQADQP
jgi:hypothetical protein